MNMARARGEFESSAQMTKTLSPREAEDFVYNKETIFILRANKTVIALRTLDLFMISKTA